ncbi:HpcH/HpaI aldolase family protein [Gluconacetobacter takamatsuzukensis]|uniref:2,4-dihydroxyhept-2-ene-1,7-dioic acid aldolase n=1 Tax=Gluconacetobacter takamatsuzukensis TaxID=1286190 RepID=A0A7W4KG85_9PROT|nr:aldolase/citrate lyase family protein [Gluconacetobacter takamatsuzukensis]MBB2206389.1 2,4-dihydroxyhept-2-ene-1,7-dioic acid aldolase [Gluconacetobacter takamatsuzukensis]
MRPNLFRQKLDRGETGYVGWLMIPSSISAEMMSLQGWDALTIDMQHGLIDYSDALTMLQAISSTDVTPLIRVPSLDAGMIGKALDAGAYGVICPMINTRAQCEALVAACRYAPLGHRSMGPVRATMYAGADYAANADRTVMAIAMIETQEAFDNLDEILSTPGLDAIFVGPSDLSLSMGGPPGFDPTTPHIREALVTIATAAKRHGVIAGLHTGAVAYTRSMEEAGYDYFAFLSELRFMALNSATMLSALRANAAPTQHASTNSY